MIHLDSQLVKYSLLPSPGGPVIRLHKDGSFEALRTGAATIEARFGSTVDDIQVVAEPEQ